MTIKAVQTDKNKRYCEYCGTWTINKINQCINLNHEYMQKRKKVLKMKANKRTLERNKHVYNMHPILKDVLLKRKLPECDFSSFFTPEQYDLLYMEIPNMQLAAERIKKAIEKKLTIGIYYDVDVDGVTSGSIMTRYLIEFTNINAMINEGKNHRINVDIIPEDTEFLIIVDSLPNDFKALEKKGIPTIILDHHSIDEYYESELITLVSSNNNYHNPHLSGAGVAFRCCEMLDVLLNIKESHKYLDLAACGIIADVSDLYNIENRLICSKGFDNLVNPFIKYLLKQSGKEFNSKFVSWTLAPLINALNRANANYTAMQLLLSNDECEIKELIKTAELARKNQQKIVEYHMEIYDDDMNRIDRNFIFFIIDEKYENYTGLIASKLSGIYNKMAIVTVHNKESSSYKGSMRCSDIDGMDKIRNCISNKNSYCLGHQEAAGLNIDCTEISMFLDKLQSELRQPTLTSSKIVDYDYEIAFTDINKKLVSDLQYINKITGRGFESIKFRIKNIMIDKIDILKSKHIKFKFNEIQFLIWNDISLYYDFQRNQNIVLDIVGELELNKFAGQTSIQVIVNKILNIESFSFKL